MGDPFDLVVVGAGPSGLAAASTAAREGWRILLFEALAPGGCLLTVRQIPDWPDFLPAVLGVELARSLTSSFLSAGGELRLEPVTGVEPGGLHAVHGMEGPVSTRRVLFATGRQPARLGIEDEADLAGHGLSHCAMCDGPLHRDRPVAIVGGDEWALQETLLLADYCRAVTVLCPWPGLRCRASTAAQLRAHPAVEILVDVDIESVERSAAHGLAVCLRSGSGADHLLEVSGLFLAGEAEPATGPAPAAICGRHGAPISSDEHGATTVPGLYAAGGVARHGTASVFAALSAGSEVAHRMIRE